jgi:pimeloyl-ACP methyl ester carboxylesterase
VRLATAGFVAVAAAAAAAGLRRRVGVAARTTWAPPGGVDVAAALATRVVGDGDPQVVLLHGLFNSGRYWGDAYDELPSEGSALVVPDLLGFGRSPKPPTGYTADAHADAVAEVLREVGAVGPVVAGAHSVGSLVALRLAARHPELVASVVAFAPPLYRDPQTARRQIARTDPLARVLVLNEAVARGMCLLMCRYRDAAATVVKATRPTLPAPLADDRVKHSWASYHETLSNLVVAAEAAAWLEDVAVPVHVLGGDTDRGLDLEFLAELVAAHPNLSLELVAGGGHDLPLTHPDICIAALRRSMSVALDGTGAPA